MYFCTELHFLKVLALIKLMDHALVLIFIVETTHILGIHLSTLSICTGKTKFINIMKLLKYLNVTNILLFVISERIPHLILIQYTHFNAFL